MKKEIEIRIGKNFAEHMQKIVENPKRLEGEPKKIIYLEPHLLSSLFTPERIKILQVLKQKPKLNIRELAAELKRKREAVSRDIHLLEFHQLIRLEKKSRTLHATVPLDKIIITLKA